MHSQNHKVGTGLQLVHFAAKLEAEYFFALLCEGKYSSLPDL